MPTTIELLMRLPITGNSPQRKVMPITTNGLGKWTANTKIVVKAVLMAEMIICAPMTVAKLR